MFTSHSSLAEISVGSDRPRRERSTEPAELERAARFERGLCRDCNRKRRPTGKLCGHCRNRIEANTVRDPAKQARAGRMSILDMDADDLRQAIRAICAGAAGLDALKGQTHLNRREQQAAKVEPLAQISLAARYLVVGILKRNGLLEEHQECVEMNLADE